MESESLVQRTNSVSSNLADECTHKKIAYSNTVGYFCRTYIYIQSGIRSSCNEDRYIIWLSHASNINECLVYAQIPRS